MTTEWIPLEPFRKAVEESGLTFGEIAVRMGMKSNDGSYVQRILGLRPYQNKDKGRTISTHMRYDTAVRLCRALDRAPHEFDI